MERIDAAKAALQREQHEQRRRQPQREQPQQQQQQQQQQAPQPQPQHGQQQQQKHEALQGLKQQYVASKEREDWCAAQLLSRQTEIDSLDAALRAMDCIEPYLRAAGSSAGATSGTAAASSSSSASAAGGAAAAAPSAASAADAPPPPTLSLRDQRALEAEVLHSAHIVFCTLSGAGEALRLAEVSGGFETAIFDEAAQAAELSTLIPLQFGAKRVVLVGRPAAAARDGPLTRTPNP